MEQKASGVYDIDPVDACLDCGEVEGRDGGDG